MNNHTILYECTSLQIIIKNKSLATAVRCTLLYLPTLENFDWFDLKVTIIQR